MAAAQATLNDMNGTVQPVFVANGGTKLHALGLYRDPSMPLVYNLDRPCGYEWFPCGIEGPSTMEPYVRHRLDVDDILALRGMERLESRDTQCIFGSHARRPSITQYGRDVRYTVSLHDHHWKSSQQQKRAFSKGVKAAVPTSPSPVTFSGESIGSMFEQAVAVRLLGFLAERRQYRDILNSVWKNVKIGRRGTGVAAMECDLLVVLKNGILIHIECKSHQATSKDLNARLLNLQQSASQLAQMAICSPCYTSFANRPWFEAQHEFKHRIEQLPSFVHIPFDLRGQPREYRLHGKAFLCATFEEALGAMLDRWVLA